MHRTITIVVDNITKDREDIDLTAEKVLDRIEESVFDHPEITLSRSSEYGLIASTTLPDSEWLDPAL